MDHLEYMREAGAEGAAHGGRHHIAKRDACLCEIVAV
jgi:hypothetical protein